MFPKHIKIKSGEELIIREAIAADAPTLIEYVNEVAGESDFLTFGAGEFKKTIEEEQKILTKHYESKNQIFLIAEIDEKIVGLLNVNASKKERLKHIGEIGISVRKNHWDKGIGSTLIETMLEWAKSSQIIRKINLTVQTNNKVAIALYKKFGFETEGTLKRDAFINRKFYDAYTMGILID